MTIYSFLHRKLFVFSGIIVEDCLLLLTNLLKGNVSNQNFFRESSFIQRLTPFFDLDSEAQRSQAGWSAQKVTNIHLMLGVSSICMWNIKLCISLLFKEDWYGYVLRAYWRPGLMVINFLSASIYSYSEKQPIRTLYQINTLWRLDNFEVQVQKLYSKVLWSQGQLSHTSVRKVVLSSVKHSWTYCKSWLDGNTFNQ